MIGLGGEDQFSFPVFYLLGHRHWFYFVPPSHFHLPVDVFALAQQVGVYGDLYSLRIKLSAQTMDYLEKITGF